MSDEPWWRDALCAEIGIELFFLDLGQSPKPAKRVCSACEVRQQCLADSLKYEADGGIVGGFGIEARRAMRQRVLDGENRHKVAYEAIASRPSPTRRAS